MNRTLAHMEQNDEDRQLSAFAGLFLFVGGGVSGFVWALILTWLI